MAGISLASATASKKDTPPQPFDIMSAMIEDLKHEPEHDIEEPPAEPTEVTPSVDSPVPVRDVKPYETPEPVIRTVETIINPIGLTDATIAKLSDDKDLASKAKAAVDWVCDKFGRKSTNSLHIHTDIGTISFPVMEWTAEGTLITILLRPGTLSFKPKFGSSLKITLEGARGKEDYDVLYGGGLLEVPGLPVVILSFLVHNE